MFQSHSRLPRVNIAQQPRGGHRQLPLIFAARRRCPRGAAVKLGIPLRFPDGTGKLIKELIECIEFRFSKHRRLVA